MPRHPPFALDNLTTENKMLASTVQFSTNDQPTTPQKTPPPSTKSQKPSTMTGMFPKLCLALKETTHPHHSGGAGEPARLFFQDPTGCCYNLPSRIPTTFLTRQPPKRSEGRTRVGTVAGSVFASVSASEHPTITVGWCGLLDTFRCRVAP